MSKDERAVYFLKKIQQEGTKAGQLYAVTGLHDSDPAYFKEKSIQYKNDETEITFIYACETTVEPVRNLFKEIESGSMQSEAGWTKPPRFLSFSPSTVGMYMDPATVDILF